MYGAESRTAIRWTSRRAIPIGRNGREARAPGRMRQRFLALALVALNLAATSNARSEDLGDCNQRVPAAARMEACTRFIQSGDQSNARLGMAYLYRATAYDAEGDHTSAIADFTASIRLFPIPSVFSMRGLDYAVTGDRNRAMADLNNAIQLQPTLDTHYVARGLAHLLLNEPDPAIADFDSALQIRQDSAPALYGRGIAYAQQGDRTRATYDITAARAINPHIDVLFSKYHIVVPEQR
jgi:tetratricopeptide (TPR) repeat protein